MILLFFEWLRDSLHFKVPSVFLYFSTRMLLAAIFSLGFTIFLGPYFIKKLYQLKIGQSIRNNQECPLLAELHQKKKDTPTMGGILILSAMILSLILWMDLRNTFTLMLLFTTLTFGCLGIVDDSLKLRYKNSKGLKSKKKIAWQILFSACIGFYLLCPSLTEKLSGKKWFFPPTSKVFFIASTPTEAKEDLSKKAAETEKVVYGSASLNTSQYMARFYLPFFKDPVLLLDGWLRVFTFFLIIAVMTGASNAVNLTDGLDGLAAGCLVLVASVLALFSFFSNHIDMARYLHILYIEGSGEIAVYMFALLGAVLGFLWYNSYPAQIFMGDTGSLALGGILGVSSILIRREFILFIAGGIFVIEALSVILQVLSYRYRNKKRIFLIAPLHHHFEYKGWPETKIVIRFWLIGFFLAVVAIASLKFQ